MKVSIDSINELKTVGLSLSETRCANLLSSLLTVADGTGHLNQPWWDASTCCWSEVQRSVITELKTHQNQIDAVVDFVPGGVIRRMMQRNQLLTPGSLFVVDLLKQLTLGQLDPQPWVSWRPQQILRGSSKRCRRSCIDFRWVSRTVEPSTVFMIKAWEVRRSWGRGGSEPRILNVWWLIIPKRPIDGYQNGNKKRKKSIRQKKKRFLHQCFSFSKWS